MTKDQASRLETLKIELRKAYLANSRMHEETLVEEIRFATPVLTKLAKSSIELADLIKSLKLIVVVGTKAPLAYFGLEKIPTTRKVWMPTVTLAREEVDPKDVLAEYARILA